MDEQYEAPEQSAEDEAAEMAAFEAAYEGGPVEEAPPEEEKEAPVESAPEPETPKALTVDDLRAMIEEQAQRAKDTFSKLGGEIGGLKSQNAHLQARIEAARSSAVGISPKAKERLAADFPELAEMLFDGAEEAPPAPAYVPPPVVKPAEDLEKKLELRLLKKEHKDWEEVVKTPEFTDWKQSVLPSTEADLLESSWDADFVSSKLTQFKEWKASKQAQSQKETQNKTNRLEAAITPKGIPRVGTSSLSDDSEEEAMVAAFGRK